MKDHLSGRYVDKKGALELLSTMNIHWSRRQMDWTAEPDSNGKRKWPWFKDPANGKLLINEGFIRKQYDLAQRKSLRDWFNDR